MAALLTHALRACWCLRVVCTLLTVCRWTMFMYVLHFQLFPPPLPCRLANAGLSEYKKKKKKLFPPINMEIPGPCFFCWLITIGLLSTASSRIYRYADGIRSLKFWVPSPAYAFRPSALVLALLIEVESYVGTCTQNNRQCGKPT